MKLRNEFICIFLIISFLTGCDCNPEPKFVDLPLTEEEQPIVDYRLSQSPVKNQGGRGTCTAFGVAAVLETFPGIPADISEQYLYGTLKLLKDRAGFTVDSGDFAQNYKLSLPLYGIASENDVPYDPGCFKWGANDPHQVRFIRETCAGLVTITTQYLPKAIFCVNQNSIESYDRTEATNTDRIIKLLDSGVKAIAIGYDVYGSGWAVNNGKPSGAIRYEAGAPRQGGHVVAIVGYSKTGFLIKNSWGETWGDQGYAYISFDYHQRYANEMLVIRNVSVVQPEASSASAFWLHNAADLKLKTIPVMVNGQPALQLSIYAPKPFPCNYSSVSYSAYFLGSDGNYVRLGERLILAAGSRDAACSAIMLEGKTFLPDLNTMRTNVNADVTVSFTDGSTYVYRFQDILSQNTDYDAALLFSL